MDLDLDNIQNRLINIHIIRDISHPKETRPSSMYSVLKGQKVEDISKTVKKTF